MVATVPAHPPSAAEHQVQSLDAVPGFLDPAGKLPAAQGMQGQLPIMRAVLHQQDPGVGDTHVVPIVRSWRRLNPKVAPAPGSPSAVIRPP